MSNEWEKYNHCPECDDITAVPNHWCGTGLNYEFLRTQNYLVCIKCGTIWKSDMCSRVYFTKEIAEIVSNNIKDGYQRFGKDYYPSIYWIGVTTCLSGAIGGVMDRTKLDEYLRSYPNV